ncbi:c2 domain containing protein [Stylonychia lemnae]|uniref:C2 domain containing protein n=1 Tax=Stylonychia lemnae TaxID=5949 RepID=A0A078AG45_STYLE|nr:c2 domain containing protein [Stylonychia lemnae]|eukprot:CDW81194.1 c2 domain containing protein [Stylonychia lemnae]
MSPYVAIEYDKNHYETRAYHMGGKCPIWDQSFEIPAANLNNPIIIIMKDKQLHESDMIGMIQIDPKSLRSESEAKWYKLQMNNGKQTALLFMDISYIPPVHNQLNQSLNQNGQQSFEDIDNAQDKLTNKINNSILKNNTIVNSKDKKLAQNTIPKVSPKEKQQIAKRIKFQQDIKIQNEEKSFSNLPIKATENSLLPKLSPVSNQKQPQLMSTKIATLSKVSPKQLKMTKSNLNMIVELDLKQENSIVTVHNNKSSEDNSSIRVKSTNESSQITIPEKSKHKRYKSNPHQRPEVQHPIKPSKLDLIQKKIDETNIKTKKKMANADDMPSKDIQHVLNKKDEEIKNQDKMMKNFFSEYERLQRQYQRYSDPNYIARLKQQNVDIDYSIKNLEKEKRTLDTETFKREKKFDKILAQAEEAGGETKNIVATEVDKISLQLQRSQQKLQELQDQYQKALEKREYQKSKKEELLQKVNEMEQIAHEKGISFSNNEDQSTALEDEVNESNMQQQKRFQSKKQMIKFKKLLQKAYERQTVRQELIEMRLKEIAYLENVSNGYKEQTPIIDQSQDRNGSKRLKASDLLGRSSSRKKTGHSNPPNSDVYTSLPALNDSIDNIDHQSILSLPAIANQKGKSPSVLSKFEMLSGRNQIQNQTQLDHNSLNGKKTSYSVISRTGMHSPSNPNIRLQDISENQFEDLNQTQRAKELQKFNQLALKIGKLNEKNYSKSLVNSPKYSTNSSQLRNKQSQQKTAQQKIL